MAVWGPVEGLSHLFWVIQSSDCCWPPVVGMRKGTGRLAQLIILHTNPTTKMTNAVPGTQYAKMVCIFAAPAPSVAITTRARTRMSE